MAQPDSRTRMLLSAVTLLRERGYSGTSVRDVIEHAGAPRGSIYHHFPGGKAQLMREAVDMVAEIGDRMIERAGDDPLAAIDVFVAGWTRQLEASDFRAGCPVVGVTVELPGGAAELAAATARAFERWRARFAALLEARGVESEGAARLATLVVASVEGAVILSRARGDVDPLAAVAVELRDAVGRRLGR